MKQIHYNKIIISCIRSLISPLIYLIINQHKLNKFFFNSSTKIANETTISILCRQIQIYQLMDIVALLLFLLIALASTAEVEKMDHIMGQDLGVGLSQYRRYILNKNVQLINKHNSDPTKTWKLHPYPKFAALTLDQVRQKYLMPNLATMMEVDVKKHADIVKPAKIIAQQSLSSNLQTATETVDLRVKYGTPVRSQGGYCGNCYAYATIDAIEMFYRRMGINSGVSLSIQQLTDCSKNLLGRGLNYGCKGGWFLESYIYVSYYGLTNAQSYPISYSSYYQGLEQPCRSTYGPYKIAKPTYFSNNEKLSPYAASCNSRFPYLRQGLAISVAMQAADPGFYNYRGGVIQDCKYPNGITGVDHAVLMVGFQTSNNLTSVTENYLLVKNSWGAGWGENGHFKVYHPLANIERVTKCFLCNYGYFSLP